MTFSPLHNSIKSRPPKFTWAARKLVFGLAALLFALVPALQAQVGGAIAVYPENSKIEHGSTRQFSAYVPITPNTVTWSVNDVPGGDATYGTISGTGFYQAPAVPPATNVVKIKATSTAFPSSQGVATLTITRKYPWLWGVSPSSLQVGAYQVSLNGSNFAPDSVVLANGAPVQTTYVSPTRLVANGTAAQSGPLKFSVLQPGNGSITGNEVTAQVAAATITVGIGPVSASVYLNKSVSFTATVNGSANTAVTWSVNGISGGSATVGTISSYGVYTAPAAMPASSNVTVRATSVANPAVFAQASVSLAAVSVPPVSLSAARFLEQSSFGPTPATLALVQQMGFEGYLNAQIALPETLIPIPADNSMGSLRQWALYNYTTAPDQLRQRVAYSLGQIIVASGNKLIYPNEIVPWMRLLSKHAFGNYRDLLRDVTISPSMGKYLDLANSMAPGMAGGANENYPRELLQLFTIGLWQLNMQGSQVLDTNLNPIPTYNQETIRQVSLALTGWTYATAPGAVPQNMNWEYFGAPMEPRQQNHSTVAKTFLGCTLPANQTVEHDLDGVLDCLMNHPNTAPFVATRLIRSLVKSNPSEAYIERVANVFVDNGDGERGDLEAVVKAILLDVEARNDLPSPDDGRLKEPILHIAGFLRALNGHFTSSQQLGYILDYMAQPVLAPATVFNWFSPLYSLPNSDLFAPEFQIYSPTEATLRGNFFHHLLHSAGSDAVLDLSPFQPYGNDMPNLVEAANQILLYGRMPAEMKQALITAATPGYDALTRIRTVLYLTALSGQHAIQH